MAEPYGPPEPEFPAEVYRLANILGIPPEQAAKLDYQTLYPELAAEFDERMSYADMLRTPQTPAARSAGRVTVAAHPLEHLADMLRAHMGGKEARAVREERGEAREQLQGSIRAAAEAYSAAKQDEIDRLTDVFTRQEREYQDRMYGPMGPPVAPPGVGVSPAPEVPGGGASSSAPPPPHQGFVPEADYLRGMPGMPSHGMAVQAGARPAPPRQAMNAIWQQLLRNQGGAPVRPVPPPVATPMGRQGMNALWADALRY